MTILQTLAACFDSDRFVCEIRYRDESGRVTVRAVSPIRFADNNKIINALCLGREEPRNFKVSQIEIARKIPADEVLMPVEVIDVT